MHAPRLPRIILTTLLLFVVTMGWNALFHLVVLAGPNAAIAPLRRPAGGGMLAASLLLMLALCACFVLGYRWVARTGTRGEGLRYGLAFALLAGLLVDANQYVLYPLPGALAAAWFAGGTVEFALEGVLCAWLLGRARLPRPPGFVAVWRFRVRPERIRDFQAAYGEGGSWAQLFQRGAGYLGTTLARSTATPVEFVTIDRWTSLKAYQAFRSTFASDYAALDARLEALTEGEERLFEGEARLEDRTS